MTSIRSYPRDWMRTRAAAATLWLLAAACGEAGDAVAVDDTVGADASGDLPARDDADA